MGASQFVGRVGGLAVALGVGAALLSTAGVASADRGSAPDNRGSGSSSGSASPSAGSGGRGSADKTAPAAAATVAAQQTRGSRSPAATVDEPVKVPAVAPAAAKSAHPLAVSPVAPAASAAVAPVRAAAAVAPEPVASAVAEPSTEPVAVADPAPEEAPAGEVVAYSTPSSVTGTGGAGSDPSAPVGHPIVDLILASFLRRETTSSAASASQTASATSSLTLNPVTTYYDGILQGNLNVTSASGCGEVGSTCKLTYSFVGSSAGGKVDFDDVPVALDPLLPPMAQGGDGSYTFLPYANWINPASPTKFPTPTGTQDFTVRVSENTKFDQTVTSIPLIGMLAAPIIKLLQTTSFIGNLLAPIIGASVTQAVSVDVGSTVPTGKQVAYTIKVTSFDGVKISTDFFPASQNSLLPALGNQQATIFNGPGLGGAGTTNPYQLYGAAGSVPGLALMRGQGYPAPFDQAPLGFNVITWDPRGEWDSGGILQLDNPFYEGRDVSALIDWAQANTPLLNETPGVPDIAMMGGSYGGGIQLTTVDPRIRTIVPSIAWNSLNQSLYPTDVFKTAWANVLAFALLLPPGHSASSLNRVNSQITQALLTGNLFGFISESAQAVLSSSGPTTLLTKLSIPTMYDQGIVDALFPLQQSLENAQTQLEQNPFFAGLNSNLVSVLWFCGGHGVCDHLTPDQQAKQAKLMFLENLIWANNYAKDYIQPYLTVPSPPAPSPGIPLISVIAPFTWWDQNGKSFISSGLPFESDFYTGALTGGNLEGGRINSFTSKSGPRTCDTGAADCSFPFNQVFATPAKNAVEAIIPVPAGLDPSLPTTFVVSAPQVSFSYSGIGNAKAVYAQVIDTATGKVLGNINTPIPVTLDGKTHTVTDFSIADIVYTGPLQGQQASSLKLQIVANSSLYQNNAVIWSVDISDLSVTVPTTEFALPNPLEAFVS
jgi:ABC-2 type transport system ATP-binding protein